MAEEAQPRPLYMHYVSSGRYEVVSMYWGGWNPSKKPFDNPLIKKVLERYPLPIEAIQMLITGKATVVASDEGVFFCHVDEGGRLYGCVKLFRKIEMSDTSLAIIHLLSKYFMRPAEVARWLGLDRKYVDPVIRYFYRARLLIRNMNTGLYHVNAEHIQLPLILDAARRRFGDEPPKRIKPAANHVTSIGSDRQLDERWIERVVEIAAEVLRDPSPIELELVEALARWRVEKRRWYLCASSPSELAELLNLEAGEGEVAEALKHMVRSGILYEYVNRRRGQHCFRIDRTLAREARKTVG